MGNIFGEDSGILSDEELVGLINAGKYIYLEALSERYMPVIIKIARKNSGLGCDVDDLIQEGIIALYSAVSAYKQGSASFHTFAVLCITRGIATALKASRRKRHIPDRLICPIDETVVEDVSQSPEKIIIDRESFKAFTDNIRVSLSGLEYAVLKEFLAGNSYSDIAAHLSISEKSVANALHRIRTKLKS